MPLQGGMAVAKHPQLVDDLLQELADLPTVSRPVACHTTATTNISSSHAAKAALQVKHLAVNL